MKIGSIEIKKAYYGIVPLTSSNAFIGTTPVVAGETDDRLRFVADAASSFYLSQKSSYQTVAQYSTDGTTWTDIPTSSANAVQMASGDTVYIRGKLTGDNSTSTNGYSQFGMTGSMQVNGNIMYWYNYEQPDITTLSYTYAFALLFYRCTSLTTAPSLPATTLSNYCYYNMFSGCSSLTTAPELPATTIANSCYYSMFSGCSSLTTAPLLPANTAISECYRNMFTNCTSLTTAPELPAMQLEFACYGNMFIGCTSLTTAPELPATTIAQGCYEGMFQGCRNLISAPEKLPATTLYWNSYQQMFTNCSSLTTAPELPATTLEMNCYQKMFLGCTNLSYIKCLATNTSASGALTNWVYGVSATGTFVKNTNKTWSTGDSGIPSGWTVQDA